MNSQLKFNIPLFLLLLVGLLGTELQAADGLLPAGKSEFTKTIKKEFNMSATGDVSLMNKYGNVDVNTWDKGMVKINVTIIVNARSEDQANKTFERINIDFSNSSDYVKAETIIETQSKSGWSLWGNNGKNSSDFKIHYDVFMPRSANLSLANKYGNATVAKLGGNAKIQVKYGDFRLDGVGKNCEVSLGYGNGSIDHAGNTRLNIKYSKLRLKEAGDVDVESKYSKVYIDGASNINSSSKYDTYQFGAINEFSNSGKYDNIEIESVTTVSASAKYSDYKIAELKNQGTFDLRYGGVTIKKLHQGFSKLRLNGKYTGFKVELDNNTNFQLDAVAEHASIRYPEGMEVTHEKEKGSYHEVKGYRGSKNGGMIKAQIDYGSLKIR